MTLARHENGVVILIVFLIALGLTVMPLPDWAREFRPQWVALTLIYWCMALPQRVGVGTAWILGIFEDVLAGTLLGQHALGLSLIAFLTLRLHQRIRVYPMWQQALTVLVLLILHQLMTLWVDSTIGRPTQPLSYWIPSLIGMLLWPLVFRLLTVVRLNFSVQ